MIILPLPLHQAQIMDAMYLPLPLLTLSSSGAPINNILWDFGDGAQSNDLNPSHTYQPTSFVNGEASFDITLVINDANNCQATEVFGDAIIIGESPNMTFNSGQNTFCQAPANVDFSINQVVRVV